MNTNWVRSDLKARGKAAFKSNYWLCVVAAIIALILEGGSSRSVSGFGNTDAIDSVYFDATGNLNLDISSTILLGVLMAVLGASIIALILDIFVLQPINAGVKRFFLVNTGEKAKLGEVLYAFKNGNYWNVVKTKFLANLYIILWTCLFIVPGIIKVYSYRMVPYILAENPQMSTKEIIDRSRQMMDGNKWKAFVLDISFIGWYFLSAITLGLVGIFFASPYIMATNAELYLTLSGRKGYRDYRNGAAGGFGNGSDFRENSFTGYAANEEREEKKDAGIDEISEDAFSQNDSSRNDRGSTGTRLNGKEL